MQNTTNYQLPKYDGTDPVNLLTGYNAAMDKVDSQMKANATAAATAKTTADTAKAAAEEALAAAGEGGAFNPSATDNVLSVTQLATVKVASNGIVYVPEE